MNHTPNYNLSQWEKSDKVLMDDFNADNAKIDAALHTLVGQVAGKAAQSALNNLSQTVAGHTSALAGKGNCQICCVTYTGTGEEVTQTLAFPDRPVLVFLMHGSNAFAPCVYGTGMSRTVGYSTDSSFPISWSGNSLSWTSSSMNIKHAGYLAVALCAKD